MKLVRYRSASGEKPGLILDGEIFDLAGSFAALNPRAPTLDDIEAIAAVPAKNLAKAPKDTVLGPPLRGIGIWIGLATGLAVVASLMLWRWVHRDRLGLVTAVPQDVREAFAS